VTTDPASLDDAEYLRHHPSCQGRVAGFPCGRVSSEVLGEGDRRLALCARCYAEIVDATEHHHEERIAL
jgi:hypothetical protein